MKGIGKHSTILKIMDLRMIMDNLSNLFLLWSIFADDNLFRTLPEL